MKRKGAHFLAKLELERLSASSERPGTVTVTTWLYYYDMRDDDINSDFVRETQQDPFA